MIVRPRSLATLSRQQQMQALGAMAALLILILFMTSGRPAFSSSHQKDPSLSHSIDAENKVAPQPAKPVPIHQIDTQVKASLFANPQLKKPLELINTHEVSCPERGGKNTQCGKVYSEYRWRVPNKGDYYLYVQVKAPTLNDNSLWIDHVGADSKFYEDSACKLKQQQLGDLVPHKHRSGSELLCCPKYLAKNAKKGLAAFYSDCCFTGLGRESNESGCVLDLEVESGPKWNQFPRTIKAKANDEQIVVTIRIYAREDGTSWTGLVLSPNGELDADTLNKLPKKSVI